MYDSVNNALWTVERTTFTLYSYSLDTMSVASVTAIGVSTPGDLTYYKGNLIFLDGNALEMVTYNGSQVETIACGGGQDFYGLANYVTSCNTNLVYAFSSGGGIYSYDIDADDFALAFDLDLQDFSIFGATTVTEYMASACPFENLTVVDCALGISQTTLDLIQIYPHPAGAKVYIKGIEDSSGLYYSLFTVNGTIVQQSSLTDSVSLESYPEGLYFISIYNANRTLEVTKKILKK